MHIRLGLALALATALAAGCSSGGSDPSPPTSVPSGSPSETSPSASAPSSASPMPTDRTTTPSPTAAVVKASCPGGFSMAAMSTCLEAAKAAYLAVWIPALSDVGVEVVAGPTTSVFTTPTANPCVGDIEGDVAEASYWCTKNSTIYVSANGAASWTKDYARAAAGRGVLASDAATAGTTMAKLRNGYPLVGMTTEYAHELGHWVQTVTGQEAWYAARMRSTDDEVSRKAGAASELSCDCFSGWAQGRAVAEGRWVDTGIGRWAHRATMAELGYTVDEVRAGFRFPTEDPAAIYGYGSSGTRVQWYDIGYKAGLADAAPLSTCSRGVASFFGDKVPPRA